MKFARISLVLLFAIALAAPALADHHGEGKAMKDHAMDMSMAPDFELADQNGEMHKLSDYRGKVVVLEWTSPECPFVQRHYAEGHTTMIDLQKKFGEDVVWMAIDSSHFATPAADAAWAQKKGIVYPILVDASGEVGRMYGAKTTPHMFVIDPEGKIVYQGAIDDDRAGKSDSPTNYVAAAVSATLAGEPVETAKTTPYGCSVKYAKAQEAKSAS